MKSLVAILLLLIQYACQQKISPEAQNFKRPSDWHCIDKHLENDMQKNRERMPLYSALSQGTSEDVSRLMIEGEEFFLNVWGHWFDALLPAWKQGLAIGCREFPWIADIPPFQAEFSTPLPSAEPDFVNAWALISKLEFTYLFHGREGLISKTRSSLEELHLPDHYQCMTKHFLESLLMLTESTFAMEREAAEKNLAISWWIYPMQIQTHISGLMFATEIDRKSEELHRKGLPIVCNDLPSMNLAH